MRGGSWWESTTPASPTDGYASARFYGHLPPPDVTARWDVTAIKPGPKCSLFAPESSPQVPSARLGCRPADLGVYTAVTACYSPGGGASVYNLKNGHRNGARPVSVRTVTKRYNEPSSGGAHCQFMYWVGLDQHTSVQSPIPRAGGPAALHVLVQRNAIVTAWLGRARAGCPCFSGACQHREP